MEILFLCHRIPYPPDKGDKIRSHALLTHLARHCRVHVACFVDDPSDMAYAEDVRRLAGGECLFVPLTGRAKALSAALAILSGQPITTACFRSRKITAWINALAAKYRIDRTVVFCSAMAPYVLNNQVLDSQRAILDLVDIDSDKWRQYGAHTRGARRWIYRRESEKLFELERFAARRFGATLLVSRHEADSFAAMAPESATRIFALTNGVNREYFAPGAFANPFAGDEDPIVMTGSMDYRPNVDGATWFFHEVLPLLTKDLPRARFYVVGSKPPASLCALCGPKLVVTGRVDDVRPYLQHAAAVVAPLRIARGLQNKVLEAMAMAKPVITTQDSSRGLSASSGVQLFIQDDAWAFAAAVVTAVQGKDRSEVARRAREYVELHHDWTRNLSVLDDLLAGRGLPAAEATSEHRSMRRLGQAPGPSVEPSIAEVPR